ncbi:hypothetical protein LPJ53_001175 [Coemansia erecta]|uniref:Uncharacterized protein n=1 Tax=Coemansia erecta TaxID=147472 RepID=A0A9W8CSG3_9FUNG|nr:hypothetical protein LPJ53_001175 [Coemansia erecta]
MDSPRHHARAVSSAPVQELLHRSPVYTEDCDLYPRRMREVMNQRQCNIVVDHRQQQQHATAPAGRTPAISSPEDIESLLKLYPGAARYLQAYRIAASPSTTNTTSP